MRMYCKKCPNSRGFNSWTNLRKHQWAVHREAYANVGYSRELTVRESNVKLLEAPEVTRIISTGEMTVSQLLTKLRDQKTFLTDVVNLIEGLAGVQSK